jgi:hypothetical protein
VGSCWKRSTEIRSTSTGNGDPIAIGTMRTCGFPDKIVKGSTTAKPEGIPAIERDFLRSDMHRFFVAGPFCSFRPALRWHEPAPPVGDRRLSSHLPGRRARNKSCDRRSWTDFVSVFYRTIRSANKSALCSDNGFPSSGRGFDSHRPLQKSAQFTLIRLPLLTGRSPICAQKAVVLRPFCAQVSHRFVASRIHSSRTWLH